MPHEPDHQASPRAIPTGRPFGPYLLQDLLGAGGMGEVYRARDTRLDRDVAVKMLSSDVSSDPDRLARLTREARLLAALNHPHIASIHELEEADGMSGLVMELVEGQTLADRLRDGPLKEDVAVSIADQIVSALQAAHQNGIVHRDLKPANIKVTPEGTVKVLDFGIAKALESAAAADVLMTTRLAAAGATSAGLVLGTPAYMSPEQARGEPVDHRTDIWAFGVVLYEMLAGRRPFTGDTTTDTLAAVIKEEPDWIACPSASADCSVLACRRIPDAGCTRSPMPVSCSTNQTKKLDRSRQSDGYGRLPPPLRPFWFSPRPSSLHANPSRI